MNDAIKRISLDVQKQVDTGRFIVKRIDTGRQLHIALTDGGRPYRITDDCRAVFTGKRADGGVIFDNCTIENNVVIYKLSKNVTAEAGIVNCEIELYGADDTMLTSASFKILVNKKVYNEDDVVLDEEEVSVLYSLISDATTAIAGANAAADNANAAAEEIRTARENGEFDGPQGPQGEQGIQGEPGPAGADGTVSDEQVASAVEAYLKENPVSGGNDEILAIYVTHSNMDDIVCETAYGYVQEAILEGMPVVGIFTNSATDETEQLYAELHDGDGEIYFRAPHGAYIFYASGGWEYDADFALATQKYVDAAIPAWAKEETKPKYTAEEVGAQIANCVIYSNYDMDDISVPYAEIERAFEAGATLILIHNDNKFDFVGNFEGFVFERMYPQGNSLVTDRCYIFGDNDGWYIERYGSLEPSSSVISVNGKTGEVNLSAADVGALPSSTEIPAAVTDDHINNLIDAKLGVIENGTY